MHKDWPEMARELGHAIKEVRLGTPEVMKSFSAMAKAATEGGALDSKTKELTALAIAVAIRCDGCVAFHAQAAVKHGATRDEIMETMSPQVMPLVAANEVHSANVLQRLENGLKALF
jgi:AhpD family alkylhydroperoxidase